MANVIDYVELAVDDLAQAKTFYAKALGWVFNDYGPDYAGIKNPANPDHEFGGLSPHTPALVLQSFLQLSVLTALPSSHCSPLAESRLPSPQREVAPATSVQPEPQTWHEARP